MFFHIYYDYFNLIRKSDDKEKVTVTVPNRKLPA